MRVPHFGQKAQIFTRPLSAVTSKLASSPDRNSNAPFASARLMPKALPDCRWQSRQWQIETTVGQSAIR